MGHLVTTLGDKTADELAFILPHEHIFADFVSNNDAGKSLDDVLPIIEPFIRSAQQNRLSALVDATALGGARRVDILRDVSQALDLPIVIATGIFKEPYKRDEVERLGEDGLSRWMIGELTAGVDGTDIVAGWIKLSVADEGVADHEVTLLKAATRASLITGAAIGSHTVSGKVAMAELDIIEASGGHADRFIWVHTQVEPDFSYHLEIAKRGAWIEYDNIGASPDDDTYLSLICRMIDAGFAGQLLLSHDCAGYNPTQAHGGKIAPYTYLSNIFLPKLRARNVEEMVIRQMTHHNPFNAYAR